MERWLKGRREEMEEMEGGSETRNEGGGRERGRVGGEGGRVGRREGERESGRRERVRGVEA